MSSKLLCFFLTISFTYSFFESGTPVTLLDSTNFDKEVIESNDIWLILFYAPWCGHCQAFSPEYEKAAKAAKGIFKIGAVDADKEKALGGRYDIRGFPTVKFFGADKSKPEEYNSARKAESVIDFMIQKAKSIMNERLGKKAKTNTNTNSNTNSNANANANANANSGDQQQKQNTGGTGNEKDVIELTLL